MPEGISVGSVTVDIVPDTRNFRRELDAKLKDLSADVRAKLDDKAFRAELDEATRDRTVNVRVDDKGSLAQAQKNSHLLLTTLVGLAPAVAPLTAVALGATAAVAGLGAAGLLAFKGIQAEMKAGTPQGLQFSGMVGGLSSELHKLEDTAASGVLDGFNQSTHELLAAFPQLNGEVRALSQSLGSDLAPLTAGLLGLFRDLDPTIGTVSGGIHSLAVDFQNWATGPGGVRFANYLATELPVVAHTLQALVAAGSHLVSALLPLGGTTLGAIRIFSDVIAHLPVGVIQDLFVAFAAYKVITLAAAASDAFSGSLKRLGLTAGATAAKMDVLAASEAAAAAGGGSAKGLIGKIGGSKLPVGGVGAYLAAAAGGVALGAAGANIITKHGEGIDNAAANKIASGGAPALAAAQAQLKAQQAQLSALNASQSSAAKAGGTQLMEAQGQIPKIQQLTSSTHYLAVAISIAAGEMQKNGQTTNATTYALQQQAAELAVWAQKNDTAASAAEGVVKANIDVHQAAADANAALKANGKTLDLNTAKGRANQTALLNLAAAQHAKIDADIAGHKSAATINGDFTNAQNQLYTMARRFGLSTTAAQRYTATLLGIPPNVLTTVTIGGVAASEAQIKELKKKEGALQFYAGQKGNGTPSGTYMGGLIHRSDGGAVWGAGTATSDSIHALLSNGEFVIKASTVKALGVPFLQQLNTGQHAAASVSPMAPGGALIPGQTVALMVDGRSFRGYVVEQAGAVTSKALSGQARAGRRR